MTLEVIFIIALQSRLSQMSPGSRSAVILFFFPLCLFFSHPSCLRPWKGKKRSRQTYIEREEKAPTKPRRNKRNDTLDTSSHKRCMKQEQWVRESRKCVVDHGQLTCWGGEREVELTPIQSRRVPEVCPLDPQGDHQQPIRGLMKGIGMVRRVSTWSHSLHTRIYQKKHSQTKGIELNEEKQKGRRWITYDDPRFGPQRR